MSEKKTPEHIAAELQLKHFPASSACVEIRIRNSLVDVVNEVRADFITNELPKLLEMAREQTWRYFNDEVCDEENFYVFLHSIADLLAIAEKGEA